MAKIDYKRELSRFYMASAKTIAEVDVPTLRYLMVDGQGDPGATIQRLHEHIQAHGQLTGKHHEIYLSEIRRAKPKNWKTILRQPMQGD